MNIRDTRALAQPQHLLDLPAFTAQGLAAVGHASLWLAHAIDQTTARRRVAAAVERPRARLGPDDRLRREHLGNDAWRIG